MAKLKYYKSKMKISVIQKTKAMINYWCFAFYIDTSLKVKLSEVGYIALIFKPFCYFFYLIDKKK